MRRQGATQRQIGFRWKVLLITPLSPSGCVRTTQLQTKKSVSTSNSLSSNI